MNIRLFFQWMYLASLCVGVLVQSIFFLFETQRDGSPKREHKIR